MLERMARRLSQRAIVGVVRSVARGVVGVGRAMTRRVPVRPNGTCPVCGRPIVVPVPTTAKMILLRPHPQELVQACRRRNGTVHSRTDLVRALDARRRAGPQTYTQQMADLEQRLRRDR
jgi:hypothetical protein